MSYAIFFDRGNTTYRLPVNPEQLEISSAQAIEKYEVLGLGQIAVPSHMELKQYSFECEFPREVRSYVETPNKFLESDFYLNEFEWWRQKKYPVRFIASNFIGNDINTLVLLEELTITEKAGEEGDKYVSFKLLQYREFGKKSVVVNNNKAVVKSSNTSNKITVNPKTKGTYVVVSGDCLWNIAKKYYGDGLQYVKIFNANRDKIKNPALIYPGQKLVIPS